MKAKNPSDSSATNHEQPDLKEFDHTEDIRSGLSDNFCIEEPQALFFNNFLEELPIPALLIDRYGLIIFVNHSCSKIGIFREPTLGNPLAGLLQTKSDALRVESILRDIFDAGKSRINEALIEIANRVIWGRLHFKPITIGMMRLVLVLIEDLTPETKRREHIEHLLQKNEQIYRQLIEEANDIVFQCDENGFFTFVNSVASETIEYSAEELIGKHYLQLIHPDYRKDAERFYGIQYVKKIPGTYYEFPFLTKKGRIRWVGQNVRLLLKSGKVVGFQSICRDITERKRMEDALIESEKRFKAIFEGAEDFIFLKDKSLKFIDVNPAGQRLLGLSAAEIIGRRSENIFSPEDASYLKDVDKRVLLGQSIQEEHTMRINGVPTVLLSTSVPLRDDAGEIVNVLTLARDITDRKRVAISYDPPGNYNSLAMQEALKNAMLAARQSITVLLTGESGSGKDYLAKYIHDHSERADSPYFSINCAAISPELAESELFGHEKGAFTGALGRKRGLLELAEGGTLLLNEIGELSPNLQAKLLTFLDTRKFTRVGGEKEISVNARIITATNRDLRAAVEAGHFRKDLFYRLNAMTIVVPPLRERLDDIPLLVSEILAKLRAELQLGEIPMVDPGIIISLKNYHWPGNVRELRNVLERALIMSQGRKLDLRSLGFKKDNGERFDGEKSTFVVTFPGDSSVNEITQELKRFLVNEALRRSGGSRQRAARMLGISRYSLKHYMKSLGYGDPSQDCRE